MSAYLSVWRICLYVSVSVFGRVCVWTCLCVCVFTLQFFHQCYSTQILIEKMILAETAPQ